MYSVIMVKFILCLGGGGLRFLCVAPCKGLKWRHEDGI